MQFTQFLMNSNCQVLGHQMFFIRPHWSRKYHISNGWRSASGLKPSLGEQWVIFLRLCLMILQDDTKLIWEPVDLSPVFCSQNFIHNFDCTSTIHSLDKELLKCKLASVVVGYGVTYSFSSVLVWLIWNYFLQRVFPRRARQCSWHLTQSPS